MLKLTNTNGNVELKRGMMKGDDGGYYIPSVNENGELTWTPSEEGMEPVTEKVGIVGPKGEPGEPGFYVGTEEPTGEELVWINPNGTDVNEFATIDFVREEIAKVPGADLTGLATEEFVNNKIAEIEIPEVDLTGYAKISDIPDTSNNATYEYVDKAVAAIEIPDTSGFALKSEIPDTSNLALKSEIPDTSAFITADDLPDTSGFTTEEDVNALISNALGVIENGTY